MYPTSSICIVFDTLFPVVVKVTKKFHISVLETLKIIASPTWKLDQTSAVQRVTLDLTVCL